MGSAAAVRTPTQNRRIWGALAELRRLSGLDEDELDGQLRERVRRLSGQEHTSRLTPGQAERLIAELEGEIRRYGVPPQDRARPVRTVAPPRPGRGDRPEKAPHEPWGERGEEERDEAPITRFQQVMIDRLAGALGWGRPQMMAFSARQCGAPWPQTQAHADKVIEPLQAMLVRQANPTDVLARAQALVGRDGLDAWERDTFLPGLILRLEEAAMARHGRRPLTAQILLKLAEAEGHAGVRS